MRYENYAMRYEIYAMRYEIYAMRYEIYDMGICELEGLIGLIKGP